ncbi:MAG: hypothetical protein ACK4IK_07775 [Bacteroidia bacterium]
MKSSKKNKATKDPSALIKLQIDYKTVITVSSKKSAENWMQRYPNAKVIN